ncbi:MAG: SAM-dependent methyltransferase [Candidatus Reconcilbacillus cellulovorans]|uniref:SAM-dependent methyltransferase n=1 Tax=Candidatus Reconcilbacillus cellulovorans TaxID=1906605 RepID=A0A2A6E3A7_9BACL|nr:MAG: SAM-dependent methyltransferase [Candidatus Reconcilbacillus cellulovorans]
MLVTTSYGADENVLRRGRRLAEELGGKWADRNRLSLAELRKRYAENDVLVVTAEGVSWHPGDGEPVTFHPGMSLVRIKRMRRGEPDRLIALSGASAGDRVIDCTAGLGADSLVFAYAVGPGGEVTAVEVSPVLHVLLREGLRDYKTDFRLWNDICSRVRPVCAHHLDVLRGMPDKSCDIVYFDPMFRSPIEASDGIRPLRRVADHTPVSSEAVKEAVRVARKSVVLKERRDSSEFERLGFREVNRTRSDVAYGVIRP